MAIDYETNKGCNLKDYLKKDDWKIIEDQFHPEYNQISESIFSIGNGRMGQRANFEEDFSGRSLQGSYIAGIYYPDKTKVGWWKIGYPEYFAKVVNSVNWIGLRIEVNGKQLDLNHVEVVDFERILDMKNGLLQRRTKVKLDPKTVIEISSERFYSYSERDKAFLHYKITNIGKKLRLNIKSFLDFGIRNQDANYNEKFWKQEAQFVDSDSYWIQANTKKTGFSVRAAQKTRAFLEDESVNPKNVEDDALVGHEFEAKLKEGESVILTKYTAICTSFYYKKNDLEKRAAKTLESAVQTGYEKSKKAHSAAWNAKWEDMDVAIEGDVAAQQGIRYTIFQLHQTYTGEDPRLNIGPKGFTGEKYGGCTYWYTEAYCLPFYLSTAKETVGKNLLKYRFDHLPKAIENAKKLGFDDGAALFPMVTMAGEECHNEWEITFEEIHRNGVMAYAIFDYVRYTGNKSYIPEYGLEVLVAISRFWAQRVTWSEIKDRYVILGVTGPNEYENNVNNNWFTNYLAAWCLRYAESCYQEVKETKPRTAAKLTKKLSLSEEEMTNWLTIANAIYIPESEELGIFLQQEGYLDKEQLFASEIPQKERPVNQNWSWDRILRSPFIKQADVLQGLYFFEDHFTKEVIEKNYNYYEPRTVHESSLSPCVHSILASCLGKNEKAYEMYLRTSRLDLDNYNNDTEDGLHITSMAGSWMSVIKGFAGMRIVDDQLSFDPIIPPQWKSYSFRILHRGKSIRMSVKKDRVEISNLSKKELRLLVFCKNYTILKKQKLDIKIDHDS